MAELLRSAKSGSDWSFNELAAYNIEVDYQDAATFFGMATLPQPAVPPDILKSSTPDDACDDTSYRLLRAMDIAIMPGAEESAVDDFAVLLLRVLGYEPRGRLVRTRKDLPLLICDENRQTCA